jgi:hypothetical protein
MTWRQLTHDCTRRRPTPGRSGHWTLVLSQSITEVPVREARPAAGDGKWPRGLMRR